MAARACWPQSVRFSRGATPEEETPFEKTEPTEHCGQGSDKENKNIPTKLVQQQQQQQQ